MKYRKQIKYTENIAKNSNYSEPLFKLNNSATHALSSENNDITQYLLLSNSPPLRIRGILTLCFF